MLFLSPIVITVGCTSHRNSFLAQAATSTRDISGARLCLWSRFNLKREFWSHRGHHVDLIPASLLSTAKEGALTSTWICAWPGDSHLRGGSQVHLEEDDQGGRPGGPLTRAPTPEAAGTRQGASALSPLYRQGN